jgi:large subunit ribosomal protein L28
MVKSPSVMKINLHNYPLIAGYGHNVSHAKNRTRKAFKYNLHTATVMIGGLKKKVRVPTRVLRQLKKLGLTSHYKKTA